MFARISICAILAGLATSVLPVAHSYGAPPPGFTNELVLGGLNQPIAIRFRPDGRLMVLEKAGRILLADTQVQPIVATTYMTVPSVGTVGERGLLDFTLDPDFNSNGFIYIYYTSAIEDRNRISRFIGAGDTGDPGSELVLWEDNEVTQSCCHFGGGLDFGPDGRLYLTTGDEFSGIQAQDPRQAGGKVIRINKDGSIPPGQPWADGPGDNLDEVWARGLRNPFRARWDLPSGRYFIGEVGGNDQDISKEDVHLGRMGANYGWPYCEGFCGDPNFPLCDCNLYDQPIFSYDHLGGEGQTASIIGGVVYRGSQFPPTYYGAYFFGDYTQGWIRYLTFDGLGNVNGDFDFEPDTSFLVSIDQGPDGALYFVRISGEVRRIVFDSGNQRPVITAAEASPTSGPAPLEVTFTGAASDFEGDAMTYEWIFGDGDSASGAVGTSGLLPAVLHTFNSNGVYQATLHVSDGSEIAASDPIVIAVGGPPTASITSPPDGTLFRFGDTITFQGAATDPDETLTGDNFSWSIVFVRPLNTHPALGPVSGESVDFPIPIQGQGFSGPVYYRCTLTVTDSDGLTDVTSIGIYPDKVDLTFQSEPPGIPLVIDGNAAKPMPFVYDTLINFEQTITTPDTFCSNGVEYVFDNWSDGGAASHDIIVPEVNTTYVATYVAGGACAVPSDGLMLHLQGDAGAAQTGGAVTAWADQSGQHNDLVAVGAPTLVPNGRNGHPTIRLDGADDHFERVNATDPLNGFPADNGDRTVFLVADYKSTGYGGFTYGLGTCSGGCTCNEAFGLVVNPAGRLTIQGWCDDYDSGVIGTGAGWLIQSAVVEADSLRHYENGVLIGTAAHVYDTTPSRIMLGAEIDGTPHVQMDVAELLLWNRALTDGERIAVENYLYARYFQAPAFGDCNANGVADNVDITAGVSSDCNSDGYPDECGSLLYSESFDGYAVGAEPADWLDTGANNSLVTNDALFAVKQVDGEVAFGTDSTATNIHSHLVLAGSADWTGYEFTGRMRMTDANSGIGVTFLSDYPASDTYYRLRRGNFGALKSFHLDQHPDSQQTLSGTTDTGVVPAADQWIRFRVHLGDVGGRTEIRASVWPDGTPEPPDWQIDAYDDDPARLTTGTIGVWSLTAGSKYWDDLRVVHLAPVLDSDSDSVCDETDNCPTVANQSQTDTDLDGYGDPCDGPFDDDHDGDVDLADFAAFRACLLGPTVNASPTCQAQHDADADQDVDLHDAAALQTALPASAP